jgi:hypothetical protein
LGGKGFFSDVRIDRLGMLVSFGEVTADPYLAQLAQFLRLNGRNERGDINWPTKDLLDKGLQEGARHPASCNVALKVHIDIMHVVLAQGMIGEND